MSVLLVDYGVNSVGERAWSLLRTDTIKTQFICAKSLAVVKGIVVTGSGRTISCSIAGCEPGRHFGVTHCSDGAPATGYHRTIRIHHKSVDLRTLSAQGIILEAGPSSPLRCSTSEAGRSNARYEIGLWKYGWCEWISMYLSH